MVNQKRYHTKIGIGISLFIAVVLIGTSIPFVNHQNWLGLIINILVAIFVIYVFRNTYYIIDEGVLIIRCGFLINKSIKISSIQHISETNNPISAPAASLDRLEILYAVKGNFDSVLVSPKNKVEFVGELMDINPKIVIKFKIRK